MAHQARRTGIDGEYTYRGYRIQRIDSWANAEQGGAARVHWNITPPQEREPSDSCCTLADCKYWIDYWTDHAELEAEIKMIRAEAATFPQRSAVGAVNPWEILLGEKLDDLKRLRACVLERLRD
jgi:hypothetical protein